MIPVHAFMHRGLRKLKYLNLSGNGLEKLSGDLSGLKSLHTIDLSNNKLTSVPESLLKLKKLKWLLIKGNPIPTQELERIMELRPDLELE
ncbi:MAG: leucine-rich repeat domain-containing protein [Bacteroidales bacterium]|nr:leucine-rich repeat domain-containing protein [Bacteroidales bacterium]